MTYGAFPDKAESWINPAEGIITSGFGLRSNPVLKTEELHDGIDIALESGTKVAAVKSGIVTETGFSQTYGTYIVFETFDGYVIKYAHLSKTLACEGEKIAQGQFIAESGNTGLTTGPHLHYTVLKEGEYKDPFAYVSLPYTEEFRLEFLASVK